MDETILDDLFSSFPCLRVLDLKYLNIKTVPDSIKKLRHLRYLNLSGNVGIELLPNSISELHNLQTLNLKDCYALKELPSDTSNLVNLRHLDISDSIHLTHMPKGMGKLTCLQTLSLFVLDSNGHGRNLSELNKLNNLRGQLRIKGLEQLRFTQSDASLANLKEKKGLRYLRLEWKELSQNNNNAFKARDCVNDDEKVLGDLEPHSNVESLLKTLPEWISSLVSLRELEIIKCPELESLPEGMQQLKSLHRLRITGCFALEQRCREGGKDWPKIAHVPHFSRY